MTNTVTEIQINRGYCSNEEAAERLLKLPHCGTAYVDFFNDGGSEVRRLYDEFFLFEIPQYGGEPQFEGAFHKTKVSELIAKIETLT